VSEDREPTPTVLGKGSHFEGLLTFRGAARVDGVLTGSIQARGRLEIGPGAHIQAKIEVDELIVEGVIEGDVCVRERAELRATAKLVGSLASPRVRIDEGSVLQGQCRMSREGVTTPAKAEIDPARQVEGPQTPDSATEML
jgi:cytoskeletal protein CcmA (bactofilin family)